MKKSLLVLLTLFLISTGLVEAQIKNAKTETVKVYGNCEMCKGVIEKVASEKNISKANWNEETKAADITYDSIKTNLDAVLKSIALAGYDNAMFLAPEEAYTKLPGCCKYKREGKPIARIDHSNMAHGNTDKMHDEHAGHDMQMQSKEQTNQMQSVFDNYFLVKDALVKSDGATASTKAATLLSALNAVKMETLKADEHTVWMQVENDLKLQAKNISESKDIAKQRSYFYTLSKEAYTLIKAGNSPETIYWQNCPMYNNGKGANWLSKESEIKNPYYGSMMLTCGSTVETIK